jgi:flagellar biosynthetic protein FliP
MSASKRWTLVAFIPLLALVPASHLFAAEGIPAVLIQSDVEGGQTWSVSLQALVLMTSLTLLPAAILLMTSFTRIAIVLGILRTALGTAQTPSNQVLIGLALFLTAFVMRPVLIEIHQEAVAPYLNEEISVEVALAKTGEPLREFMVQQTRNDDLLLFLSLADSEMPQDTDDVPFLVLVPAFVTSELKTAFQIGFILFIPFLIIDLVVASVLMSMGMMMLSPLIISLPFKLMLFVLVDGWNLVLGTLAGSFFL